MRNKIVYFSISDSDDNEHLGLKVCYNQMQAGRPLHLNEVAGATSENIAGVASPASERGLQMATSENIAGGASPASERGLQSNLG